MAKSWQEHAKDALGGLSEVSLEALDSVRHKVVEQGYFGQEQTGYITNIYGTNFSNPASENNAIAQNGGEAQEQAASIDPKDTYVRFEPRPNEEAGWWHGEPEPSQGASEEHDYTPRNGWDLGENAADTVNAMDAEQNAPEQEM